MRADCRRVQIFAYHLVCKSEVEPICFEMQWIEQYVGSWSFMISAKEWQLGRFWCWSFGMGQWGKLGNLWPLVALGSLPIGDPQEYVCGFSYSF